MHRCGIIDHGRNALLLEARLKCIALFPAIEANGVLRPTRIIAFGRDRSLYPARQQLGVESGSLVDIAQLVLAESLELYFQNGGLQSVQARVHADAHIVVLEHALAVHPVGICQCGPFVVVGKHRSAIAVTAQRLGGEKRSGGDVAETACTLVAYHAAEPLRTILKDEKPVGIGYLTDSGIVGGKAEQIDGNDDLGCQPAFLYGTGYLPFQIRGVHIERIAIHIHKNGRGSFQRDDLCRREESEVGHEYGISRTDVPYFQGEGERVRTVAARNAVFHSYILRQPGFELFHGSAHDKGACCRYFHHGGVYVLLQYAVLFL